MDVEVVGAEHGRRDRLAGTWSAVAAVVTGRTASLVARTVLAWAVGVSGAVATIRGWGDVVVSPAVQPVGVRALVLASAAWLAAVAALGRRPSLRWASFAAFAVATPLATAANVGRAPALVVVASSFVAQAALVDWWPGRGWPERRQAVAWPALAPLVAAQVLWVSGAGLVATVFALAVALALVEVCHRRPAVIAAVEAPVRRVAGVVGPRVVELAGVGRVRLVARWEAFDRAALLDQARRHRIELGAVAASVALMVPTLHRYSTGTAGEVGSSDYETHLGFARITGVFPPRPSTPHPLYHYSVSALRGPLGEGLASTVVLAIAVALTAIVLVVLARGPFAGRPGLGAAPAAAFALGFFLTEAPSTIAQALHVGNSFDWAPTDHMHLSPTDTLLTPFAIALLLLVARALAPAARLDRDRGRLLAAVTVAAALAKPSMNLVLLVAIPVHVVVGRLRGRRTPVPVLRFLARWFVAPSLVLVAAQTWLIQLGTDDVPKAEIAILPFDTIRSVDLDRAGPLLLASGLVLPLCLWAGGRRYLREPAVALALWAMAVGLAVMILINETGELREDGVFTKPAFMAWGVLHVVSWRFLLGEAAEARRSTTSSRWPAWLIATAAFVLVGLVSGVLALLEASGWMYLPVRGT